MRRLESKVMSASTSTESKFLRAWDLQERSQFSSLISNNSSSNRRTTITRNITCKTQLISDNVAERRWLHEEP
eukprot:Skav210503  [mRNA]  locus=scaffold601:393211:393993:- [translate_table: standard]